MRARSVAVLCALALLGTACTGGSPRPRRKEPGLPFARGGTLRLTLFGWDEYGFDNATPDGQGYYALDPGSLGEMIWEIQRCCLLRTLMSYNGTPTAMGGADPQPDIAAAFPQVSSDGLTWTFQLKRGLHYGPPFQGTEIVAQDFIRALQRSLSPGLRVDPSGHHLPILDRFDYLFWVIQGAREYERGSADSISGIEAPDAHTLVFHLTEPTGDLAYRLALPAAAPIPPNPTDPQAAFGAATGHSNGYGPYLVSSGPYMIEGSQDLDFSKPPDQQAGASGYVYAISLDLVRNPSWNSATDPLRPAYPDRIELALENESDESHSSQAADLPADRVDIGYFSEGANGGDDPLLKMYQADPSLRSRLFIYPADFLNWMAMNMAIPPFDDIHVRKAVNLIIDKRAVQALNGGHIEADPAGHLAFDSLEDNLLLNYNPYGTPDEKGDLEAAEAEVRQSRYDRDGDGRCDDPACARIPVLVPDFEYSHDLFEIVRSSLARIGLMLDGKTTSPDDYFPKINDSQHVPDLHLPLVFDQAGFKDFPSGSNFFGRSFGLAEGFDLSLVGASPQDLARSGYKVRSVPSVTDRVRTCQNLVGRAQPRCWADLDQYLMEQVVPWVPLLVHNRQRFISDRVQSFTYDQFTTLPSPDRIALRSGSEPTPSPSMLGPVPAIPNGVYRFTLTAQDYRRFHGTSDPDGLLENTGTFTATLRDGQFESVQTGDHAYFAPIGLGHYRGSGDTVRFSTDRPAFNLLTTPPMRWSFDGRTLHFTFLSCQGLHDPKNPTFCNDIRVVYEAHPWVKVG
jgi:peptide/nickel transport system substrate-binding protein